MDASDIVSSKERLQREGAQVPAERREQDSS